MEITSWNKAAEDLYGYTAAEAIGKKLTSLTLTVGKDKGHLILEVVVCCREKKKGSPGGNRYGLAFTVRRAFPLTTTLANCIRIVR